MNIDVRVVAATNRDIKECVTKKSFRKDLFYRVGEFIINIPPLRERAEDIPFFVNKFILDACTELNRQILEITVDALDPMMHHAWVGL
jgi:transcriptional regulator with GAF, ATPase, and Fis domain